MPQPQPQPQQQRERRSPSVDSRGGSSAASSTSISISSNARRSGRPLVGRTGASTRRGKNSSGSKISSNNKGTIAVEGPAKGRRETGDRR